MKFDEQRLRGAIHMKTQKAIAENMKISQSALSQKLKDLDGLRFRDFYAICDALGEKAGRFIMFDKEELDKVAA